MTATNDLIHSSARSLCSRTLRRACRTLAVLAGAVIFFSMNQLAQAAPINYGTFAGNTVTYVNVTEDSNSGDTLPLFGPPSVSGDSIDFNPVGFDANATGPGGNDITDGNLSFMIVAKPTYAVDNITLAEAGDTTLAGFGTDATFTSVTANVFVNINEVDGVGIPTITVPLNLAFTPSGGTFGLLTDGGGGPLFNSAWSGSLFIDIEAILNANSVPHTLGATKVSLNIDNTLVALSQQGTFALIAKKDFGGVSITVNVPEPATWMLAGISLLGLVTGRRRIGC